MSGPGHHTESETLEGTVRPPLYRRELLRDRRQAGAWGGGDSIVVRPPATFGGGGASIGVAELLAQLLVDREPEGVTGSEDAPRSEQQPGPKSLARRAWRRSGAWIILFVEASVVALPFRREALPPLDPATCWCSLRPRPPRARASPRPDRPAANCDAVRCRGRATVAGCAAARSGAHGARPLANRRRGDGRRTRRKNLV